MPLPSSNRYSNFTNYLSICHYQFQELVNSVGYHEYTAMGGQYIEDVAHAEYGDPSAYYVLAAVNNIIEGVREKLAPGTRLIIPNRDILDLINAPKRD
jgi:hypothetical protein